MNKSKESPNELLAMLKNKLTGSTEESPPLLSKLSAGNAKSALLDQLKNNLKTNNNREEDTIDIMQDEGTKRNDREEIVVVSEEDEDVNLNVE